MKSKILFDGNCIVCDIEVSHYKRVAPEVVELVDISSDHFRAETFGLAFKDVDKNLHVITPGGQILIGVDAFAHIWSRIPRYQMAEKLVKLPVLHPLAKAGYFIFTCIRPYLPKKRRQ